ncbi:hypothetical protein T12_12616, partial [Trichinella patagoniensis]
LERHKAEPANGGEAVERAGDHVDHGEENRVAVAVNAEEAPMMKTVVRLAYAKPSDAEE